MKLKIDPHGVRILVVDDEEYITDLISDGLGFVGFEVETAYDGLAALAKVASWRPDLIVLDITMPGIDGLEVVTRLRSDGVSTPIVFLTARDAPAERVKGLHLGADDYITKPFGLEELLARIEAVLRRVSPEDRRQRQITVDDLTIDHDAHIVRYHGKRIDMSPTEFNVLEFLMMNADRVVTKQQILEQVWNYDFGGESTVVETYISYLRKKLDGDGPPMIHTLRGIGYVLRSADAN